MSQYQLFSVLHHKKNMQFVYLLPLTLSINQLNKKITKIMCLILFLLLSQFPYYPSGSSAAEIQNFDQLDNSLLQSNVIQEFYKESQEPLTAEKSIPIIPNLHSKFGSYRPMAWTTEV